jgi:hypothetical protein
MRLTFTQFFTFTARLSMGADRIKAIGALPMLVVMASVSTVSAAPDQGLATLHRVVDTACGCAEGHASGLAAALSCTQGPREFGRLKVMHRATWNSAARARADDLEKVIELCLSNALSARVARERLGQAPVRADGSVPQVYWQQIAGAELRVDSRLVRILHRTKGTSATQGEGKTSVGIVQSRDVEQLQLRLAKRDGGGSEQISLHEVERAWVMMVSDVR